jgi:ABC-type uncharacterized transport system permease subunit
MQVATVIIGAIGFACSAGAVYLRLRRGRPATPTGADTSSVTWPHTFPLLLAGLFGIAVNISQIAWSIHDIGTVETFRHNFESTLLLATLIGTVAMLTHLSAALRGLDGFLFASATIVQISALLVLERSAAEQVTYKPWFVSHSVAFALAAACFIAAGVSGAAYLIINRLLRRKRPSMLVGTVAPLESLERFGRWMLMIGFPLFTYGILTGICEMVRAKNPGGPSAWLRDPLVMASFVTWAVYAVMVASMWLRPQFRGRRAASLATCGMALVTMVFLVLEFVSTQHK